MRLMAYAILKYELIGHFWYMTFLTEKLALTWFGTSYSVGQTQQNKGETNLQQQFDRIDNRIPYINQCPVIIISH